MDKNKTILITGCSTGIGYTSACLLKERGYRVFATARKQQDVDKLNAEGLESIQLDLDDSDSIQTALKDILQRTNNELFALFNNGAYGQAGAVEDLTRATLRQQFETNLFGTVELTNRVLPIMRKQGYGRIIQNSSVLGLITLPYRGAYNASKYALEGITDTLRLELDDTAIHVSLIEPGPIESAFRKNAFAAYQRNIDREHSAHREKYAAMEARLEGKAKKVPFKLPAEAVTKKLIHALESPKPKARYYVTFPTYLFGTLRRLLSTRQLDFILRTVSQGEHQPNKG